MAVVKDVRPYTTYGSQSGVVVPLANGSLVRAGGSGTKGIYKSTDNGQTWTLKYTYGTQTWESRLNFVDSVGNVYIGTIDTVYTNACVPGHIFRSSDNGDTWSDVATSQGTGWWRTAETGGKIYASEYSEGLKDAAELYAYNVWVSSDQGLTWSIFYTAPHQSTPGAKDGIRHVHHISNDSSGGLYIGFGDPGFSSPATKAYALNPNATLGTLLDSTGNGWVSRCQLPDGNMLFGGDNSPNLIYHLDVVTKAVTTSLNPVSMFGAYDSAIFDILIGRDGVIYALSNGASASYASVVYASPDNGTTWVLLQYEWDLVGSNFINTSLSLSGGRIYVTRAQSSNSAYVSFPDFKKSEILGPRVLVR